MSTGALLFVGALAVTEPVLVSVGALELGALAEPVAVGALELGALAIGALDVGALAVLVAVGAPVIAALAVGALEIGALAALVAVGALVIADPVVTVPAVELVGAGAAEPVPCRLGSPLAVTAVPTFSSSDEALEQATVAAPAMAQSPSAIRRFLGMVMVRIQNLITLEIPEQARDTPIDFSSAARLVPALRATDSPRD